MEKTKLAYSSEKSIATITFNDGKGNVLDHIMMEEIQNILNSFFNNKDLKLIIFEGEGKHFSFGASVEEHQQEFAAAMLKGFHQLFYTLRDLAIPTLAKVSGQCLGGGMEIALMCNFIFADQAAKFGQPEAVLGVFPPPASILLPEKIGYARAEELLITGKIISASEALQMGLVNHVFEDKIALNNGIETWIKNHIVPKSASSLRYNVKATRVKLNHLLSNFLPQLENMYVHQLMQTEDANEGITAFIEKRTTNWKNQ